VQRFISLLEHQLEMSKWAVTGHSRGVETAEMVRYPDVVVERLGHVDNTGLATKSPSLLVEVLSPSTESLDLNIKPSEYTRLASLVAYFVASQDERISWVWQRGPSGDFPVSPIEVKGSGRIKLDSGLGVELPIGQIYRGTLPPRRAP
jgi:Uma2 family endonuclease